MSIFLSRVLRFVCVFTMTMIGCAPPDALETEESRALPVVRGAELERYLAEADGLVLVEFGVDFQCERCRQMKTPMVDLAERLEGRAEVIRVDFNANVEMVSRLGGTVCPTYVVFQDGNPIHTESFPVSAEILESRLSEWVQ